MIFAEYDRYDALGLAELVRRKEIGATDLLDTALARVAERNPATGAVVALMEPQARAQIAAGLGDGPFAGVPFLLKDLLSAYAGVPMNLGSAYLRDEYVPAEDSECVTRWKRAGLVMFGKTSVPEFGLVPTTEPAAFPPTRNPWNHEHVAGGSSGGSAAAVAAGMAPMASANDGGGSIRIPAACCGLVGLKPTRNRNPLGPDASDPWMGLVVEHVVARSVRDSAAALDATAGPDAGSQSTPPPPERPYLEETRREPGRLRIAVSRTPAIASSFDPEVSRALEATIAQLTSLGHDVVEAKLPVDGPAFASALLVVIAAETASDIAYFRSRLGRAPKSDELELGTRGLAKIAKALSAADLADAVRTLRTQARRIGTFMQGYDLFLSPTLAKPPVKLGTIMPSGAVAQQLRVLVNLPVERFFLSSGGLDKSALEAYEFVDSTPLANATGAPAISLPLAWSASGLPLGMMFTARFGDEATLIRLAAQLETAAPWFERRPELQAV